MPTHEEIERRRRALTQDLRLMCEDGSLPVGEPLPRTRELAERFGVSHRIISDALKRLHEEGLLYSVPRVGTFVGKNPGLGSAPFLFLSRFAGEGHIYVAQMRTGFEDRVAALKGNSASFTSKELSLSGEQDEFLDTSGVFYCELTEPAVLPNFGPAPLVRFAQESLSGPHTADSVDFDHQEGGEQATRHLLELGHTEIAFLGLHGSEQDPGEIPWSALRMAGWQKAMEQAGKAHTGLSLLPQVYHSAHQQAAAETARKLLHMPRVTAIITVNSFACHGLVQMLKEERIPMEAWPAIVSFDETPRLRAAGVSYLRLPWETVGTEAAQLLWERTTGRLTGPPQERLVKMRLIPRLTCRADWGRGFNGIQRRLVEASSWQSHIPVA